MAASAVVLLAACSGTPTGASSKSAGAGDCSNGPVKLTVLRDTGFAPTDAQLGAYTKQHPCVTFTVTEAPFTQYLAKLPVALASSNPPDIYDVDGPTVAAYQSKGVLMNLDKYLPASYTKDVDSADLEEVTVKGHVVALPKIQNGVSLFYNKDLTDKAGITVPTDVTKGWTWEQAKAAMLKCQNVAGGSIAGLAASSYAASASNNAYRDLLFLRSAGDPKAKKSSSAYKTYAGISPDKKTVDGYLNSPQAIKAATFYQGLFNGPDKVAGQTVVQNQFVSGQACFDLTIASAVGTFDELPFKAGVSAIPHFVTPIVHTGSLSIGVPPRSKHKDEAAKAAVAMSTGDIALDYASASQSISPLKSVRDKSPWLTTQPNAFIVQELTEYGEPRPINEHYDQYGIYIGTALHNIMNGSNPKQELDNAVQQIDAAL